MTNISKNVSNVLNNIDIICKENSIDTSNLKIMAVSKHHAIEKIKLAYDSGLRLFGESKVQEYQNKHQEFKNYCLNAEMYFIGKLQSNKTKKAVELFDGIMSIDSLKLARKINAHAQDINKKIIGYLQINIGNEEQKSGILLDDFEGIYKEVKSMQNIVLQGIMCIPPLTDNSSKYFLKMNEIKRKYNLEGVSQGMSRDYKQAIQCGTNMIRIGTAIFNERDY